MEKTVRDALIDEVFYPVPEGYVYNIIVKRQLNGCDIFSFDITESSAWKGAVADCLSSLIQSVGFSEADKTIQPITDDQRRLIIKKANALYDEIGEPRIDSGEPTVTFGYGKKRKHRCRY